MKYQRAPYTCGPTAIENAAEAIGMDVSGYHVEQIAGTTERSGTSDRQMLVAIKTIGLNCAEFEFKDPDVAWPWLLGCLDQGIAVILCCEDWEHWVTAVGRLGNRVVIADPAQSYENQQKNGIRHVGRVELLDYWVNNDNGVDRYYGIGVML